MENTSETSLNAPPLYLSPLFLCIEVPSALVGVVLFCTFFYLFCAVALLLFAHSFITLVRFIDVPTKRLGREREREEFGKPHGGVLSNGPHSCRSLMYSDGSLLLNATNFLTSRTVRPFFDAMLSFFIFYLFLFKHWF